MRPYAIFDFEGSTQDELDSTEGVLLGDFNPPPTPATFRRETPRPGHLPGRRKFRAFRQTFKPDSLGTGRVGNLITVFALYHLLRPSSCAVERRARLGVQEDLGEWAGAEVLHELSLKHYGVPVEQCHFDPQ
jgi:hypothetical protein